MMKRMTSALSLSALLLGTTLCFTGCEANKGPGEKMDESIDRGANNVKDAITPAGPVEKAGRAVDDAVK